MVLGNAPAAVLAIGQQRNSGKSERFGNLKYDTTGNVGTYQHNIKAHSCNHCWGGKSSKYYILCVCVLDKYAHSTLVNYHVRSSLKLSP